MPSSRALPLSASCSVARVRIRVDLPAPFGPRRPNMPCGMDKQTSCNACVPLGYRLERFSICSCISLPISHLIRKYGQDRSTKRERSRDHNQKSTSRRSPETGFEEIVEQAPLRNTTFPPSLLRGRVVESPFWRREFPFGVTRPALMDSTDGAWHH